MREPSSSICKDIAICVYNIYALHALLLESCLGKRKLMGEGKRSMERDEDRTMIPTLFWQAQTSKEIGVLEPKTLNCPTVVFVYGP